MVSYPQYRERYFRLATELEKTEPENLQVLEALAERALAVESSDRVPSAIHYLHLAVGRGSTLPADYEQLGNLLLQTSRTEEALDILQRGIRLIPYDVDLYRLQGEAYLSLNKPAEARATLKEALRIAPQDSGIRKLLEECETRGLK
jgi:tetratricopeptide (TPR) repeat protein